MSNPKLRLGFREPEIDTNRSFTDDTVKVEGFDLEINSFRGSEVIDAWDASSTTRVFWPRQPPRWTVLTTAWAGHWIWSAWAASKIDTDLC
jgi:hypothetical protein